MAATRADAAAWLSLSIAAAFITYDRSQLLLIAITTQASVSTLLSSAGAPTHHRDCHPTSELA